MSAREWISRLLLIAMASLSVGVVAACGGEDIREEATLIRLADTGTGNQRITNAVAKFVLEVGFDHTVEVVTMSRSEMQAALASGTIHLNMEIMQQDILSWYNGQIESGNLVNLGTTYEADPPVEKVAHGSLQTIDPDLVKMLRKFNIRLDRLEKTIAWVEENDIQDTQKMAIFYLFNFNFEDGWKAWMPFANAEPIRQELTSLTGLRASDTYKGQVRKVEEDEEAPE